MSEKNIKDRDCLKFIILGDRLVGKTSFVNQFVKETFIERSQLPIGVDVITKEVDVDGKLVKMRIWDINGQTSFASFPTLFCRANCCILVYDVSDPKSFDSLDIWREEFVLQASKIKLNKFLFILIGNKTDVENRTVSTKKAKIWCGYNNIPYFETSAAEDVNVENAFQSVVRILLDPESTPVTHEIHDKLSGTIRLNETSGCSWF